MKDEAYRTGLWIERLFNVEKEFQYAKSDNDVKSRRDVQYLFDERPCPQLNSVRHPKMKQCFLLEEPLGNFLYLIQL